MSKSSKNIKALIIGGGGNKGAGGAGKIASINKEYDLGVGVSTGALMLVPALLGEHDLLRDIYTNTIAKDIFDFNPFNKKGHIKIWWLITRIILGKPTLAESNALRKTLQKIFDENNLWTRLQDSGKEAVVGVYNNTKECTEYISSKNTTQEEFLDFTWASACQPPIMSILRKNGDEYVDGGVQEVLPMKYAVDRGAKHLTVIAHRPKVLPVEYKKPLKNLIHNGARLLIGLRKEITDNDIELGIASAKLKKCKFEIHYVSQGYGENDLLFNKEKMNDWYNEAFTEKLNPQKK